MAEPRATYQGIPCRSWRAARTPGFESDSYEVEMPTAGLSGLKFEVPGDGSLYPDATQPGSAASGRVAAGNEEGAPAIGGQLFIRGDLIISDGTRTVEILGLYVRDDGLEVVDTGDNEDGVGIVKLFLVDIRYFWGRRGELWGRYNIPVPGEDGVYEPDSLDNGAADEDALGTDEEPLGKPLSLKRALSTIATRLPGHPIVDSLPKDVEEKIPTGLKWEARNPRDEMERLCTLYGLTATLTLDNKLVFTDVSEQRPDDGKGGDARAIGGASLEAGGWRRTRRIAFRHRAEAVRVVGPRVVREVRVDKLEPVGHPRHKGTQRADESKLVPWEEAAESYGLTLFDLSSVVLIPPEQRVRWFASKGLDAAAEAEVERWAFRMFRIPKEQRGFLPILQYRASKIVTGATDDQGRPLLGPAQDGSPTIEDAELVSTPLVEADVYVCERVRRSELDTGSGTEEVEAPATDDQGRPLQGPEAPVVDGSGRPVLGPAQDGSPTITDPLTEAVDAPEAPPDNNPKTSTPTGGDPDGPGTFGQVTLDSLKRDSHDPEIAFYKNVRLSRMPTSAYSLNEKDGIVRFDQPIGHLVRIGITDFAAQLNAIVFEPKPRVRITFAYEDSAAARRALESLGTDKEATGGPLVGTGGGKLPPAEAGHGWSMYHYHALFNRPGKDGEVKPQTDPGLRDKEEATGDGLRFPLVVPYDSMQLAVTLNGASNRAELDKRALEIAEPLLAPSQLISGEDGIAYGAYPILPSSVISSVDWEGGEGDCRTRWTIDNSLASKARLTGAKIARFVAARPEGGALGDFVGRVYR